jgi:hypothetical protein
LFNPAQQRGLKRSTGVIGTDSLVKRVAQSTSGRFADLSSLSVPPQLGDVISVDGNRYPFHRLGVRDTAWAVDELFGHELGKGVVVGGATAREQLHLAGYMSDENAETVVLELVNPACPVERPALELLLGLV